MKIHRRSLDKIVATLSKACSPDTLAHVLDDLLCADAHPDLSDDQSLLAELIFDELARINPTAVEKAQSL